MAQCGQGPVLQCLDRAYGLIQYLGHRLIIQSLDEPQEDDLALILREAGNGNGQPVLRQPVLDGLLWVGQVSYRLFL